MSRWKTRALHFAEFVCAMMLALIFATFILQIIARYILSTPFGWTLELCAVLWVAAVFLGNAFIVRDRDQVTFDIIYLNSRKSVRKVMALISAAAIAGVMVYAFLPTWEYIDFLKIRSTPLLKIPFNWFFMVYIVFMVALIVRYTLRFIEIWRKGPPDDDHQLVDYDAAPPAIEKGEEVV